MIRRSYCSMMLLACAISISAAAQTPPAQTPPAQPAPAPLQNVAQQSAPATAIQNLTLQQAEQIALQNHPQVQAAMNLATAAAAQAKEVRSIYYPQAYGSLTGAEAESDSRIAAGLLNSPQIFDKYANGATVNQLVTDFGRTHQLVKSSNLHSQAQQENVVTSRADVLLQVDEAYYGALKAQAVLQVAQATVTERQAVSNQITTMAANLLKSTLDVAFANVDLSNAQLLLITAQNDVQASFAVLSAALGYADQRTFTLADVPLPAAPTPDIAALIQQAMQDRPELVSGRLDANSAQTYATAERDLYFPTVSAVGAAGLTPLRQTGLSERYAAAGFNVNIPIFNGHLYGSLKTEAQARAQAQNQNLRDLQDRIVRDVRTAWLNAQAGYQRLSVTEQLLNEAMMALNLAQARYQLGLSSIVELTQSQLNLTQAQIAEASAKYDYEAETSAVNYQIGALR